MRIIMKMISVNKQPIEIEMKKLTSKQKRHIAVVNQLKADGYKIIPMSANEFGEKFSR